MIELSNNFIKKAASNSTKKIIAAHIYYTDSEYLRVATATVDIDGYQYLGIIDDLTDSTHQWDMLGKNTITISAPNIVLKNYQNILDDSLLDDFFMNNYLGKKLEVFFGYEGLTITDFLQVFSGRIDDIDSDNQTIRIKFRNFELPSTLISGQPIDPINKKIGNTQYSTMNFPEELKDKVLPVPFGLHWNAPVQLLTEDSDKHLFYATHDNQYVTASVFNFYQTNVNQTSSLLYIEDSDYLVPWNTIGFDGGINYTQSVCMETTIPCFQISNFNESENRGTGKNIIVDLPMRMFAIQSGSWAVASGYSTGSALYSSVPISTSSLNDVLNISSAFMFVSPSDAAYCEFLFSSIIPLERNIRTSPSGSVMKSWNIHVPSSATNYASCYLAKSYYDMGGSSHKGLITIHSFLNYDTPTDVDVLYPVIDSNNQNYIGGTLIPELADGLFDTGSVTYQNNIILNDWNIKLTPMYYKFIPDTLSDTSYDFNFSDGLLAQYGNYSVDDTMMGYYPSIDRTALEKYVGCRVGIMLTTNGSYRGFMSWTGLHALYVQNYELDYSKPLYTQLRGPENLKRPYQYLEYIINKKLNSTTNWSATGSWTNLFSTFRDDSGFVINEPTKFNEFIQEYCQNEPFTIYLDESGDYKLLMTKTNYSASDIVGYLDFDDSTDFRCGVTLAKNLCSEIKSMQTNYSYAFAKCIDDYHWKIKSDNYDYSFWISDNSYTDNRLYQDTITKKYTSYVEPDRVNHAGHQYSCLRTHTNQEPSMRIENVTIGRYWEEMTNISETLPTWNASSSYHGIERENYIIAKYILNNLANRRRTVEFKTTNIEYLKYGIGDIVGCKNVPFGLLGMSISGFNNSTSWTQSINGQTVYGAFIITSIDKSMERITIEATQLVDLNAYDLDCLTPLYNVPEGK